MTEDRAKLLEELRKHPNIRMACIAFRDGGLITVDMKELPNDTRSNLSGSVDGLVKIPDLGHHAHSIRG